MSAVNLQKAAFVKSAARPADFIRDGRPNIVFAGRSNVGKSSVINRLLNRKNLAFVGAQPGKTSHINYFLVDDAVYFTDLPGYGYAKVARAERARWGELMERFFAETGLISLGVLVVDARHVPTADDETMADWFRASGCPLVVAANKADKVKRAALEESLARIRATLRLPADVPVFAFSAETGAGRDALLAALLRHC